jgi:hypothetical protein
MNVVAEIYDAFREAKVSDETARKAAAAVAGNPADLATKADLEALRLATKADLKQEIALSRGDFNTAMAKLETRLHQAMIVQTRWLIGTLIAMTGIFAAIVKLL